MTKKNTRATMRSTAANGRKTMLCRQLANFCTELPCHPIHGHLMGLMWAIYGSYIVRYELYVDMLEVA